VWSLDFPQDSAVGGSVSCALRTGMSIRRTRQYSFRVPAADIKPTRGSVSHRFTLYYGLSVVR